MRERKTERVENGLARWHQQRLINGVFPYEFWRERALVGNATTPRWSYIRQPTPLDTHLKKDKIQLIIASEN